MDEYRSDAGIATVYFYFDFNDKEKQKTENLLSSLITQLSDQSSQLPKSVEELYERSQKEKARPTLDGLQKTLISLFSLFNQVYVHLDALDESTDRKQLLKLLSYIWKTSSAHLHILVTSRKERDLESALNSMTTECIGIESAEVDVDIKSYVEHQLGEDQMFVNWPIEAKKDITTALTRDANGMYVNTQPVCRSS